MKRIVIDPGLTKGRNLTFSPAVRMGSLLFVSGMVGKTDEKGEILSKGDIKSQAREAYEKIRVVLEAAGATFDNVIKTTDYVTTFGGYKETAEVRQQIFGRDFPAATGILVQGLTNRGALIEIEAIAVIE